MGGKMSRNKGKRGEREVINELQVIVDEICAETATARIVLQRNLLQADFGGCDLHGLAWLSLEVKRVESNGINGWWAQTLRQCSPGQTPVLCHRRSHMDWSVRMRERVKVAGRSIVMTIDIDFPSFLVYFRERLRFELRRDALAAFMRGETLEFQSPVEDM